MIGWYDPPQLFRTGIEVAISTIFGRYSDYRILEALRPEAAQQVHSISESENYTVATNERGDFWFDYVADVGDGWHSTYAIAYYLAQEQLQLEDAAGTRHHTERGSVLLFGGDEVYPVASRSQYEQRLILPYVTALPPNTTPRPDVFAIPGNHDWYDSLVSFTRLLCSGRPFAGWMSRQKRSYFALALPHGWWVLGTDIQLASDIDEAQVSYFKAVAQRMKPGDRVILCNAEPHWIYAKIYGEADENCNERNLAFLERMVLGGRVSVFLAGDLHHYRRHEAVIRGNKVEKITAGGGGAFLHPTHGPDVSTLEVPNQESAFFTLQSSFPIVEDSRRLCRRNFIFLLLNPWFGALTGLLYVLTASSAMTDLSRYRLDGMHEFVDAVDAGVNAALTGRIGIFWGVLLFLGFVLFTDTHSKPYRWVAGPVHGAVHVIASFFIGWGAIYLSVRHGLPMLGIPHLQYGSTGQILLTDVMEFLGGWIVGSTILGIYLWMSLNLFGHHLNEAFSSLAIADWKNFLRFRIDAAGTLTIYPIGIRRVPRRWKDTEASIGPRLVPDDPRGSTPELIEPPVIIS